VCLFLTFTLSPTLLQEITPYEHQQPYTAARSDPSLDDRSDPPRMRPSLVQAADSLDWEEIQRIAQEIRCAKLKNAAGRPPHLRATLGAVLFMALRKRPYRETEDVIRY